MLKRTPLYEAHLAAGARLVPFAGWEMPVQYSGVIEEVRAVRSGVGVFDVSHMGEVAVSGPAALAWLNSLTTNDVSRLSPGRAQYSLLLREDGGILDDILVYQTGDEQYLVVLNASNTAKDLAWLRDHAVPGADIEDVSDETALLAVQGPGAQELLAPLAEIDLAGMRRFGCAAGTVAGVPALVARTGYTGEDGFELFVGPRVAGDRERQPEAEAPDAPLPSLWGALMDAGAKPCGLGARDVLRLEAGNVLYGHEIDEETTPLEAGLEWVVKPEKGAFLGSDALAERRSDPVDTANLQFSIANSQLKIPPPPVPPSSFPAARRLVGFQSESRAIPRQGYPIVREGDTLGVVTSGTYSPTLERPIGMGYVTPAAAGEGDVVQVLVRERPEPARIVALPFYRGKR